MRFDKYGNGGIRVSVSEDTEVMPAKRHVPWKTALVVSVGGAVAAGSLVLFLSVLYDIANPLVAESPIYLTASASSSAEVSFQPAQPFRLRIPTIGVDAVIQSVGLSSAGDGAMGVPSNFTDVAWYNQGPRPGEVGSAVIDGHLDGKNVPRGVFIDLDRLVSGDLVSVVGATGSTMQFIVVKVKTYKYIDSAEDVFLGDTSRVRLNLITCAGTWLQGKNLFDKRTVVFTEYSTSTAEIL